MSTFDHFNFLAPVYERFIPPSISETLRKLLDIQPGCLLLDAAGGTGRVSLGLHRKDNLTVIADSSRRMLQVAKQKGGLRTVCTVVEDLPFPDQLFDRVMMVDALHHVEDQAKTAADLWRVLKPGGRLVIEEPDIRRLIVKGVAVAEKIAGMRSHILSIYEMAALFSGYPGEIKLHGSGHTVWLVVDKRD